MAVGESLQANTKVDLFRAGVWKPRTRPGSFEGIGTHALPWLVEMREATGLPFLVEVGQPSHVEAALEAGADAVWIGARTTVNPFYMSELAEALRGSSIPVAVKNPIHADMGLWLGALERLEAAGLHHLAAIHRGFFASHSAPYRNDPMWELTFELRREAPEIPIFCDPSHIAGKRDLVHHVAQIALDLGMEGLMVETHPNPSEARSDADQQVTPDTLADILNALKLRSENLSLDTIAELITNERDALDEVDSQLVELMLERKHLVQALAEVKASHGASIFQMDRWFEILQKRGSQAESLGLDKAYIEQLFQVVHKYSVEQQTKVYDQSRKPS